MVRFLLCRLIEATQTNTTSSFEEISGLMDELDVSLTGRYLRVIAIELAYKIRAELHATGGERSPVMVTNGIYSVRELSKAPAKTLGSGFGLWHGVEDILTISFSY
jgi:hypothetical protein